MNQCQCPGSAEKWSRGAPNMGHKRGIMLDPRFSDTASSSTISTPCLTNVPGQRTKVDHRSSLAAVTGAKTVVFRVFTGFKLKLPCNFLLQPASGVNACHVWLIKMVGDQNSQHHSPFWNLHQTGYSSCRSWIMLKNSWNWISKANWLNWGQSKKRPVAHKVEHHISLLVGHVVGVGQPRFSLTILTTVNGSIAKRRALGLVKMKFRTWGTALDWVTWAVRIASRHLRVSWCLHPPWSRGTGFGWHRFQ